jgi:hypothetical protein
MWKLGGVRSERTSSSYLRIGYRLIRQMFQVLRITLTLPYFRLKLKMLVKEARLYQVKGSVGFAEKRSTQKELA